MTGAAHISRWPSRFRSENFDQLDLEACSSAQLALSLSLACAREHALSAADILAVPCPIELAHHSDTQSPLTAVIHDHFSACYCPARCRWFWCKCPQRLRHRVGRLGRAPRSIRRCTWPGPGSADGSRRRYACDRTGYQVDDCEMGEGQASLVARLGQSRTRFGARREGVLIFLACILLHSSDCGLGYPGARRSRTGRSCSH